MTPESRASQSSAAIPLEAANALESATYFIASVVGAAVAGVLIAAVGGANKL
jgi:hypothetical protein